MELYTTAYIPISKMLEIVFWKIGQKTRGRAEFMGLGIILRGRVFLDLSSKIFKKDKILYPNR